MLVKIFFCYAHEDEVILNKLKSHLMPLQRQGLIDVWYDRDISAGTEWEKEIGKNLDAAQIILLLISPDFMASEYCYGIEMKRAIERHERNEANVIPVILHYVDWQVEPFNKLQALPTDGKPVMSASWHNLNEALFDVAKGIREAVERLMLTRQLTEIQLADEDKIVEVPLEERNIVEIQMHPNREASASAFTENNTIWQEQVMVPHGLTLREVEVLRLMARGWTDAQIAMQLIISPRTVNAHTTSIYRKIGVSSRSAATRYAIEQKLV